MPLETTPRLFRLARCCIDDFQHVREAKEDYEIPSHPIWFQRIDFEYILLEHTRQSEHLVLHFDDDQPRSLTPHQL